MAPSSVGRNAQSTRRLAVGTLTLALGLCAVAVATVSSGRSLLPEAAGATAAAGAAGEEPVCEWSYAGANGPEAWGKICNRKYPLCATGTKQSPVNIKTLRTAKGPVSPYNCPFPLSPPVSLPLDASQMAALNPSSAAGQDDAGLENPERCVE